VPQRRPLNCGLQCLTLALATAACGEVSQNPEKCEASWYLIAREHQQRLYHAAVWTGEELLVWGGLDAEDGDALVTGWRIEPKTGRVRPISNEGGPSARWSPFAVWTGHEMLLWGGQTYASDRAPRQIGGAVGGSAYDPETDAWRPIADPRAGTIVADASAWTGSELFVWGGGAGKPRARQRGLPLRSFGRRDAASGGGHSGGRCGERRRRGNRRRGRHHRWFDEFSRSASGPL
jgi:hypothetical protein